MTVQYIDDAQALQRLCDSLQASPFIAIDTEFVREQTYYPRLGLIQIADENTIACIDPVSITDLSALRTLLFQPSQLKVFHAARQDMEVFYHLWGSPPAPVYDTQIAAALLGQGEQVGYANLVKQTLGVDLAKTQSRTDWLRRPLSDAQIRYAADDVRYLVKVYNQQRQELESLGRLEWLAPDFEALCEAGLYCPEPEEVWRRIKGASKLRGVQLAVLRELAAWRERLAMAEDRPRRRLLADEALVDIARLQPRNTEALRDLRGIHSQFLQTHGDALIENVERARETPKVQWPVLPPRNRLNGAQEAMVDVLAGLLKLVAAKHKISPAALGGRKELEQLVAGEQDVPLLKGWRRAHAGELLLSFIQGECRLEARGGALVVA